jgi:hypothetical protein
MIDIQKEIEERYSEAKNSLQPLYDKMEECHHYYNGKQWRSKDKEIIERSGNIAPELNIIAKQIDSLIGRRISTLTDLKAFSSEIDDTLIADLSTNTLKWIMNDNNAQSSISLAHKDQLLGGMGWLVVDYDVSRDFISGDIKIKYERSSNILPDPNCESLLDLDDADYIFRCKNTTKRELKKLFPDKAEEIDSLKAESNSGSINKRNEVKNSNSEKVTVKEYWYKSYVTKKFFVNRENPDDIAEWLGLKDRLLIFLKLNPQFKAVDIEVL